VGTRAERRAASKSVAAYHEARLADLIEYIVHHYHRAARELWKFCWSGGSGTHTEMIAQLLNRMATDGETIDWWERVTSRQRD